MLFEGVNIYNKIYDYPFEKVKKIGVAGTNGKTTTAKMICHILRDAGVPVGFISKDEISMNEEKTEGDFKNSNIEKLFKIFDRMIKMKVEIVVIEVDDWCFETSILQGINFDMIVYTSIEIDHIKNTEEIKKYMEGQKSLLNYLLDNGIVIVNTDDKSNLKLLENIKNRLIITYGLSSRATITASSIDIVPIKFNCCIQRGITPLNDMDIEPMEFPIAMNFIGRHNVYNTLAAVSAALIYGVLPENIIKAVRNLKRIKRRMYKIDHHKYQIIDDRCHNPSSFEAVFEAIQSVDYESLYIVNAIIGNKGIEINKRNAKIISNWVNGLKSAKLITTCSTDVVDKKDVVLEDERDVFHQVLKENEILFDHKNQLKDALYIALSNAARNDLILLLGSSGMDEGENLIRKLLKEKK
ncbi:Mur ligase family protein [Crassaminicella profunda]|uniref:Mur ligase family protein n=1 Tax=Crassaminicella profunda TaxID=1286698 RepID=UPI001CA67336|nr:Mur ligase family protein [Crassaminicella profunda]QZY56253.1 UDP-N-acetylmuramyl peptide synthase [Crassaminicella profunda]